MSTSACAAAPRAASCRPSVVTKAIGVLSAPAPLRAATHRVRVQRRVQLSARAAAPKAGEGARATSPQNAAAPSELSPWALPPPPSAADLPPPPPAGALLYPPPGYAASPYAGAYPGYYAPPPKAPQSGLPPWMWVALGVALAGLGGKLLEGAKSKQADIQQAMMQQMLKSMMGGAGGAGGPGGMPPGFPGAMGGQMPPGMGGMPFPPRPAAPAAGKGATVDTTATAVKQPAAPTPPQASAPKPVAESPKPAPKPAASSSYFRDAEVVDEPVSSGSGSSSTMPPPPPPPGAPPPGMSVEALENMMRDPSMQKLIYPYLPEGMRNPQTFEWMLKNPATRAQLENMLAQNGGFAGMAGGAPGGFPMADALKNFDMNAPEVQEQFQQMGMKPEEVVSKIMANPSLTAAFQNPRVQAAIMDCSQNPMNITKYQDDKEIMDVFMMISEVIPNGGMPMPPQ